MAFIPITAPANGSAPEGADLKQAIQLIAEGITRLQRLRLKATVMASQGDYALMESRFGLPAGTGAGVLAAMQGLTPLAESPDLMAFLTGIG